MIATSLAIGLYAASAAATTAGTIYAAHKQASSADKAAKLQQASNTAALDWSKESYKTEQAQYLEERQRKWTQEDVDRKTAEEDRLRQLGWTEEDRARAREKDALDLEDRQRAIADHDRRVRQMAPYVEFGQQKLNTLEGLLRPGSGVDLHIQHAVPPAWAGADLATAATPPPPPVKQAVTLGGAPTPSPWRPYQPQLPPGMIA